MSLRVLAWKLNHRAKAKVIPPALADAIASLEPDAIVLNEYVHGDSRHPFLEQLAERGFPHWQVSRVTPLRENHILIAARNAVELGSIQAPGIEKSIPSNFLHAILPKDGCEVLGLRIPDYSSDPKTKRACWSWIIETAASVKDHPFVLIGDFNTDPDDPDALCRDCRGSLMADGKWRRPKKERAIGQLTAIPAVLITPSSASNSRSWSPGTCPTWEHWDRSGALRMHFPIMRFS